MNEEILISVIIPVYKAENTLSYCTESVLTQSYKNLELILIDDGSPDNSGKLCDEIASKDSRVKVIHKQNGGVSNARNAGLDIATGDYIMFVDNDDIVAETAVQTMISIAIAHNADLIESSAPMVGEKS